MKIKKQINKIILISISIGYNKYVIKSSPDVSALDRGIRLFPFNAQTKIIFKEETEMRIMILSLCFVAALMASAHAAEMYRCLDDNGNAIITSAPQDWMRNCVLKEAYDDALAQEKAQKQNSPARSKSSSMQADKKLRNQCAKLDDYRKEARTYCEGVPQSYKSGDEAMKKSAQNRMASSNASASRNCDYYRGMVRELEAKCP
ncbi:MAG: DUF4124 domain-containing protein [Deltaproteobacteria bacterium]